MSIRTIKYARNIISEVHMHESTFTHFLAGKKKNLTFWYNVGRSGSLKGRYPAIKTYRMTPHDQTSAAAPS